MSEKTPNPKLTIANEMRQLDRKNRDFYDDLTPEERKKFSTFLMLRWGSAVEGSRELQEYYVQSVNHYLNRHFFSMSRHPKLQWLMATAASPNMGTPRHVWIALQKKQSGATAKRKRLAEIFPHYRDDEIEIMMAMTSDQDLDEHDRQMGQDSKK
jgi:hypothetical protein